MWNLGYGLQGGDRAGGKTGLGGKWVRGCWHVVYSRKHIQMVVIGYWDLGC